MTHLASILYSKKGLDICNDSNGPSMFVIPNHPVNKAYKELKERGIRLRFIAEITKDNRHVNFDIDEVRGNGIYYRASAKTKHSSPPPLLICSTLRAFVEQQQYFFEMLWRKAIPAKQRIKEIEEGVKREFIETIQNSEEATSMVLKVLSSATEEIQMIFYRAITLKQYEKLGILNIVRKKAGEEVLVKILIGMDSPTNIRDLKRLTRSHKVELRYLNKSIQIQLTTIIIDRELSLVIEEKGDKDLNGFATYSNSESTIMSYASIFKNLWAKSTIYDSGMNAH